MDIARADLNLLTVFAALHEHQSVTRAGQALGLSQPAMSAALAKARVLFADPLFVRGGGGMRPTARAQELIGPVRRVLGAIRSDILDPAPFDPAIATRSFTIITPDIGEIAFLPRLLARLATAAPGVDLRTLAMPPAAMERALESGAADLAPGLFPDLTKAGFYQQRLFRNSFLCIVRPGHPLAREGAMTLKGFLSASHAVIRPEGRSHDFFERELQKRGHRRRVRLEIPHFLSLPVIIAESDLVATVPRDIALSFARRSRLRVVEPPVNVSFDVKHYWHGRARHDPASSWLRRQVWELFHD